MKDNSQEHSLKISGLSKKYVLNKKTDSLVGTVSQLFKQKKLDEFWALNNINLEVKKGEVLGIIGHNGAGKSTLLKILSKITPPTSGIVELQGRVASLLEVGTGFHPELTGRENIFLNGSLLGMTKKEIENHFEEIIEFAGIGEFIDVPVKRYSSGMYVRLAFSVAAHLESDILLVDEVLAVGDLSFQQKCLSKMHSLTSENKTVVFISHNLSAINSLCERVVLLEKGKLISIGKPTEIIQQYLDSANQSVKLKLNPDMPIIINEVSITGQNGNQILSFEDMIVNFYFHSISDIELINLRILIKDKNGAILLIANNSLTNQRLSVTKGEGHITCTIKRIPFISGVYYLTLELLDFKHFENDTSIPFEVLNTTSFTKEPKQKAGILLDYSWNSN
jgi:lipopolysaccharide transport system ATP-binding protein